MEESKVEKDPTVIAGALKSQSSFDGHASGGVKITDKRQSQVRFALDQGKEESVPSRLSAPDSIDEENDSASGPKGKDSRSSGTESKNKS